jgi:hypothetical protein
MSRSIVGSLFGPTPEQLQRERMQQQAILSQSAGRVSPSFGIGYNVGTMLGQGLGALFGVKDPELEQATAIRSVLTEANKTGGSRAEQLQFAASKFEEMGLGDLAFQAYNQAQEFGLAEQKARLEQEVAEIGIADKGANLQKTNIEIAQKTQDLENEKKAQTALLSLQEIAKSENRQPTAEEIINTVSPYIDSTKLAGLMQTSSDKEAYRDAMLKQAEMAHQARLMAIQDRNERDQLNRDHREEMIRLKSELSPNTTSKSSVFERGYANNFVTSAKELVPATTNLNILTQGGSSPITAGVFTNLGDKGVLSATGKVIGTSITPTGAGQYESIMLPVIQNIGTMQNAGRRTTISQLDNLKTALIAKPGQPYIVQIQKMGELRQIAEAAAEAALVNPAMSEDQKAAVVSSIEKVKESIPFSGADAAKFSLYAKKNPNVKFLDWLKVNGEDLKNQRTTPRNFVVGKTYTTKSGKKAIYQEDGTWKELN